MDLIAIHKAASDYKDDIKNQCCEILNDEWPRSETLRLRSLNSSRDDLPLCLALVEWFQNPSKSPPIERFFICLVFFGIQKWVYHAILFWNGLL